MFGNLRNRLLISYLLVISGALLVITLALFAFAAISPMRYTADLQRLIGVSGASLREIRDRQGQGQRVQLEELTAVLDSTAADTGVRIVVADRRSNEIVYDTDQTADWVGISLADLKLVERTPPGALGNGVAARFQHPTNGSRWLIYANGSAARLQIYFALPEQTAVTFFTEFFARPLAIATVLSLGLAVLFALLISRSVGQPLSQMVTAAEAIAAGDYDQKIPPRGPSEVQRLASSFNTMSQQVKATHQAQRDFVANVSHDLKTPITSVAGWSQALLDGTAVSPSEQQQAANIIYDESQRMGRMVNQLLDLARIESGQLRLQLAPVDLRQLLQEVQRSHQPTAEAKGITLQSSLPPVPPVAGDADRLTQIFNNLLENALAHTLTGGTVSLALIQQAGNLLIQMSDNGSGIPPADLPRIFERFYQVDKSRARQNGRVHSGLGLAIVKELVEAHNGRISASSQLGQGTVFSVTLPLAARQ